MRSSTSKNKLMITQSKVMSTRAKANSFLRATQNVFFKSSQFHLDPSPVIALLEADVVGVADIAGETGLKSQTLSLTCILDFVGVIVVTDSLQAKQATLDDVHEAASKFILLDELHRPRSEKWRYVLEPDA